MEVYDRHMTVYAEKEHFIPVIHAVVLGTRPVLLLIDAHLESYTPGQDQAKSYVPVFTSTYKYIPVQTSTGISDRYVLVRTGTYKKQGMKVSHTSRKRSAS